MYRIREGHEGVRREWREGAGARDTPALLLEALQERFGLDAAWRLAAGAVALEDGLEAWLPTRGKLWPRTAAAGLVAAGGAGAINLFGPKYGLPRAISAHQNHYFWGPQGYTGEVLIVLESTRERCARVQGLRAPSLSAPARQMLTRGATSTWPPAASRRRARAESCDSVASKRPLFREL